MWEVKTVGMTKKHLSLIINRPLVKCGGERGIAEGSLLKQSKTGITQ